MGALSFGEVPIVVYTDRLFYLYLKMNDLIASARKCTTCESALPHGVNPVFSIHPKSKIAIIGQAPGRIVHETGVPWDDKSGERLRAWLGVDDDTFYNPEYFAIVPMGFCFPGSGKSGDLPPRPECAPQWHKPMLKMMPEIRLTLLIGTYAQRYYLKDRRAKTLTETVKNFADYLPDYLPLPHPSPRNNIWMAKNRWFEEAVLPLLKGKVQSIVMS